MMRGQHSKFQTAYIHTAYSTSWCGNLLPAAAAGGWALGYVLPYYYHYLFLFMFFMYIKNTACVYPAAVGLAHDGTQDQGSSAPIHTEPGVGATWRFETRSAPASAGTTSSIPSPPYLPVVAERVERRSSPFGAKTKGMKKGEPGKVNAVRAMEFYGLKETKNLRRLQRSKMQL